MKSSQHHLTTTTAIFAATTLAASAQGGTLSLETSEQTASRSISSISPANSQFQVFTLPAATTDTLLDSFTVSLDDFTGTSGGQTFSSLPLAGFILELDRGLDGAEDDRVTVLNSQNPETVSFNTSGFDFIDVTFSPRDSFGNLFALTPGEEYAILLTVAGVETPGANFSTNVGVANRATSPEFFGASSGLELTEADLENSEGFGSLLAAGSTSTTVLATTITLVPEPSSALLMLGVAGLLVGRTRRA